MRIFFLIIFCFSQLIFSSDNNYVFGWTQLNNPDLMNPRGGTSSGPDVDLDEIPNLSFVEFSKIMNFKIFQSLALMNKKVTNINKSNLFIKNLFGELGIFLIEK